MQLTLRLDISRVILIYYYTFDLLLKVAHGSFEDFESLISVSAQVFHRYRTTTAGSYID